MLRAVGSNRPTVRATRRIAAIAGVVAGLLLAAGCGDDGGSSDTLPPMITTTTTTTLPVTTTTMVSYYEVQSGDILSKIAESFGVTQADLMSVNGIDDPDHIEVGQVLKIPPPKQVADTLPPTTAASATSSTVAP
ncbi:MAG: LysM domain [Actinomycetota bacterium]|jgi:LysM repeat protein